MLKSIRLKKDRATARPKPIEGQLILEDGSHYNGIKIGSPNMEIGEVCFNTSMTGYQEIITDPSYAGQIINFTFPHIGNVGTNFDDDESRKPFAKGIIINCDISDPSNYRSILHLDLWLKKNNIDAFYSKEKLDENQLKNFFHRVKNKEVNGANITVPFKKSVIPYLDELSIEAECTQSVNTVYLNNDKIIGHNTDTSGFELAIKESGFDVNNKKILILGAGGVVPSIIYALNRMKAFEITICNRTKSRAEDMKTLFNDLIVMNWGEVSDFDMIINATSIGLNEDDNFEIDFTKVGNNKFFYDVIYNPSETNFLKEAKVNGNKTENGRMMFIYQAHQSFALWNKVLPKIDEETIEILK